MLDYCGYRQVKPQKTDAAHDMEAAAADYGECIPEFRDYFDLESIKKKIAHRPEQDQKEFIQYCDWCIRSMAARGRKFQQKLANLNGEFAKSFVKLVNQSTFNRVMSCTDTCSRDIREWAANRRRMARGIHGKGYDPEEGKDLVSTKIQACAYIGWGALQFMRVITGAILFYGQYEGDFPAKHHAHPSDPDQTLYNRQVFYNGTATGQAIFTGATAIPAFFLHSPPQFRECCRGFAELNTAELAALNCFKHAVDFMSSDGDTTSLQNLLYKFGMESFKRRQAKWGKYDALRYMFSSIRETVAFPGNLIFSALVSINLAGGQTWISDPKEAGVLQTLAGVFGILQAVLDSAQGACEIKSAEDKLDEILKTIERLNSLENKYQGLRTGPKNEMGELLRSTINNVALVTQKRQQIIQVRERDYGYLRYFKGMGGFLTSLATLIFGAQQAATGAKFGLYPLISSLTSTTLSGAYYAAAFKKMWARNEEKMLKKKLCTNAEFVRLNFDKKDAAFYQTSGVTRKFHDYRHLFWKGRIGEKVSRDLPFQNNEYIALDILTDFILAEMHQTENVGELPDTDELVNWLHESWGVSKSIIEATLKCCCDKAHVFQRDQLKQGLAKLLRTSLALGPDKLEKRIKASLVVLAAMRHFDVEDSDAGKDFARISLDFTARAQRWSSDENEAELLRGVMNKEEFIASVLHVFYRCEVPENLDAEWIKFAKMVAVAQALEAQRSNALLAVADATRESLKLPPKTDEDISPEVFEIFQREMAEYAKTSVLQRGKLTESLRKLSKNELMQSLLILEKDRDWMNKVASDLPLEQSVPLLRGIKLLSDRVDLNQPLPANVPSSPRNYKPSPKGQDKTVHKGEDKTVRVPSIIRAEQSSESSETERQRPSWTSLEAADQTTRKLNGKTQAQNANGKHSYRGPDGSETNSTSTPRNTPVSVRTDANVFFEISETDILVSAPDSDSEDESTQVILRSPVGIEEV